MTSCNHDYECNVIVNFQGKTNNSVVYFAEVGSSSEVIANSLMS